jgi:predicted CoA-binding protein
MHDAAEVLRDSSTILVVDWPSTDVPISLARSGHRVVVNGGPEPDNYNEYVVTDEEVETRFVGRPPDQVDLVYVFRPIDELPAYVAQALSLGARAVWLQSGLDEAGHRDSGGTWLAPEDAARARSLVEVAGLVYVDAPYIGDVARS